MDDEISYLKKELNNTDFYIWLFGRYKGRIASEITEFYSQRRMLLYKRYIYLTKKNNGDDEVADF